MLTFEVSKMNYDTECHVRAFVDGVCQDIAYKWPLRSEHGVGVEEPTEEVINAAKNKLREHYEDSIRRKQQIC